MARPPRIDVEHTDGEATVPDPKGSDLWLDVQKAQDRLEQRWSVPSGGDWALLSPATARTRLPPR